MPAPARASRRATAHGLGVDVHARLRQALVANSNAPGCILKQLAKVLGGGLCGDVLGASWNVRAGQAPAKLPPLSAGRGDRARTTTALYAACRGELWPPRAFRALGAGTRAGA
jgi:hypothetical protein